MPGGDRTGPAGQGPMTGRGLGFCGGAAEGGGAWGGRGRRMRAGRGWRNRGQQAGWPFDVEPASRETRAASTGDALADKLDELSERIARLEAREPKP
jgi:hypothetical protein